MTEELTPEQIYDLARGQVDRLNRIVVALLVDASDQMRAQPDTWQHEEVTLAARDLAAEALAVEGIAPEDVVFATARASSIAIGALCKQLGIDPTSFLKGFEENFFRMNL
ncbi:hypothetical protein J2Y69_002302 [Microbacterium resistens]|uniref:Uncharacterized protein n=1 Tax=Microbacterium resistens TaxID=156977 RepID=A0ABU1SFG6_9MICO|nr:hypothetical protein [Microbacterium resistens]MDR6867698.1 hypothetical protein [Microbacterium resistens]